MSDFEGSLVTVPHDYGDVAKLTEPGIIDQFLERPAGEVVDIIMGAFAVGKPGLIASGRRLALGLLKGRMYKQLAEEIKVLRDAGKLSDDFAEGKNGFYTWAELMAIIDDECPDADRLEALKAMFYAVNKTNAADAERMQAYQLWSLTKQLKSGEIFLLRTIFQELNSLLQNDSSYLRWAQHLAKKTGFGVTALIDLYDKRLTELFLITPRQHGDGSGIYTANGRLTDLGMSLCRNIDTYHIDLEATAKRAAR